MTLLVQFLARLMFLPLLMVSIAVLVKGYSDIGDGFSAGVIAGLAIILQAIAFGPQEFDRLPLVRYASIGAILGLFLEIGVAFMPVLLGDPIFTHRPKAGEDVTHFGTVEFITPVLFDIGVYLIVIGFCAGSLGAIGREAARREREQATSADRSHLGGMP